VQIELADGVRSLPRSDWDALVGDDSPFLEWDWLASLAAAGWLGPRKGWDARPLLLRDGDELVALRDIMPTLLGLAGVPYPERFDGRELLPMEGKSFAAVFQGESKQRGSPLYWEFFGNRAVREGRWKLVAGRGEAFALYDMEADGTELRDLSGDYPERFSAMKATYHTWARQTCATPNERARRLGASNQQRIYPEE